MKKILISLMLVSVLAVNLNAYAWFSACIFCHYIFKPTPAH